MAGHLSRFHHGWPVVARDFAQVCLATAAIRDGLPPVYPQRSPIAGALPGLLARHLGIIDGLVVGALIATAATVAGIYLWARAAHSRAAGLAAAGLAGAVAPLALLTRSVDFYPQITATWTGCAALAMAAVRWPGPWTALAAGAGIGAALSVDPRGLLWALAAIVVVVPVAARRGRTLLALVLPVALSYGIAHHTLPRNTPRLETQLAWFVEDVTGQRPPLPPDNERFLWGWSSPAHIPATLRTLAGLPSTRSPSAAPLRRQQLDPWLPPALAGLLLAGWALRRRPWRLAALVGTGAPSAVALWGAAGSQVMIRHLAYSMPVLPVVMGVGLASLVSRKGPGRPAGAVAVGLGVLLAVAGVIPGALSPGASWRTPFSETPDIDPLLSAHPAATDAYRATLRLDDPRCRAALQADQAAGHPWGSRIYAMW